MESRLDFQRLLEDMDKVIQAKRLELSELDERLESARSQLSEEEAKELRAKGQQDQFQQQQSKHHRSKGQGDEILEEVEEDGHIQEQQRQLYEKQLEQFGEELTELESINQKLAKENQFLRLELRRSETNCEELGVRVNSLAESLEEVHSANLELNLRLAYAESEQQLQQKLLKKTHDEDEVLMDAFNDKLESLKRAIESKDEEIRRLRLNNQFLLESFSIGGISNANGLDDDKLALVNGGASINDGNGLLTVLTSSGIDHDLIDSDNKQRVIEIVNALREKDSQIELLKSQLLEATKDLERNASLIEGLNKIKHLPDDQLDSYGNNNKDSFNQLLIDQMGADLPGGHRDSLGRRFKMLEQELEAKDKQLSMLEFRNHSYETILPNKISDLIHDLTYAYQQWQLKSKRLSVAGSQDGDGSIEVANLPFNDSNSHWKIEELIEGLERLLNGLQVSRQLLDQIDRLKEVNKEREAQIERLVKELNQLAEAKATNSGGTQDSFQSTATFTLDESLATTKIGTSNLLEHNEQERVDGQGVEAASKMNEPVCQVSSHSNPINQSNSASQVDVESKNGQQTIRIENESNNDMKPIAQHAEAANNTNTSKDNDIQTNVLPPNSKPLGINSPKLAKTSAHQTLKATTTLDATLVNVQTRQRHLEKENELLELAMKEILLALKWTDSQCSTILIDCPSLERLCQLIEARFMARSSVTVSKSAPGNESPSCGCEFKQNSTNLLFQLVVLKSELDLMRGQNEQLRTNLKSQRRDYLSLFRKQQANQCLEMGCQTEINNNDIDQKESSKCKKCARSINLTDHLLQCIMRIEERVNSGDEFYRRRLVGLHKLIKLLERDLMAREKRLNETLRECHQLTQQKLSAESRLSYLESQLSTVVMPIKRRMVAAENLQVYHTTQKATTTTATKNGLGDSSVHHQSVTTIQSSSGHHQQVEPPAVSSSGSNQGSSRLTISLLQSIISCLQARLDYKDERLQQLELMLLANPAGALVGQSNEPWKRWGAEGQLHQEQQSAARG